MSTLSFANQKLSGLDINSIALPSRQLRALDFSFNVVSDVSFVSAPLFAWLETLDLSNNNIRALPATAMPQQLRKLDVSHNFLQSLSELRVCRFLISLRASHNALTVLARDLPPDLAVLDVANNGIGAFEGALDELHHLHTLRVQNNELAVLDDITSQVRALPELRYLHVAGNAVLANAPDARQCDLRRRAIAAAGSHLKTLDGVAVGNNHDQQQQQHRLGDSSPRSNNIGGVAAAASGGAGAGASSSASSTFGIADRVNEHASKAQQLRDERRKCQALREMLKNEMRQEATLELSVEQLQRQIRQEKALQRSQLANVAKLRRECELASLDVEQLKVDVEEQSLTFLSQHAETKRHRIVAGDDEEELQLQREGTSSNETLPSENATPVQQI